VDQQLDIKQLDIKQLDTVIPRTSCQLMNPGCALMNERMKLWSVQLEL